MNAAVWLTGCRGMLGTEVGLLLAREGVEILATDREVDITDKESLERFASGKKFGWIVNCAGYTAVDKAEDEPEKAFRINAEGPSNLALIAREADARLIHISTDYVFDGRKKGEYLEDDSPNPISVYGRSKLEGDRMIMEKLQQFYIIRTAWLFGKYGKNFVETMLRLFKENEEVKVVHDQWGTPTYAVDLAHIIRTIIKQSKNNFGIFNFTNDGVTNWFNYAKEIYSKARKLLMIHRDVRIIPIMSSQYPCKAKRPLNSLLSKEKVKTILGVTVRNWKDALDDYLNSMDENHHQYMKI